MSDDNSFGTELRRLRRGHAKVISLADIADVLGCSITYVSSIERGERNPPSNEKIRKVLKFLGCENETDRLIDLAVKARKAVEFPVDGTNPRWTNVLLGLARRSEEGLSADDPLIAKLDELLKSEEENAKQCLPLFHASPRSQSGKSKKKRKR